MPKIEITDDPVSYCSGPWGYFPVWGLTADGARIGTVWETERGYAGQIEGPTAAGELRQFTCPELAFRQAVIDHLGEAAGRIGIA